MILAQMADTLAEDEPQRVQVARKARATTLIQDESGAVVGVAYEQDGQSHKAYGPVILATGGYAADFADKGLLAQHRPDTLPLSTTNGEHCTGDGHKMCIAIGASTVDMDKVQVHPTGLVDPAEPDAKTKFLAYAVSLMTAHFKLTDVPPPELRRFEVSVACCWMPRATDSPTSSVTATM